MHLAATQQKNAAGAGKFTRCAAARKHNAALVPAVRLIYIAVMQKRNAASRTTAWQVDLGDMGIARERVVTVTQVNNEQCYSARATTAAFKSTVRTAESDREPRMDPPGTGLGRAAWARVSAALSWQARETKSKAMAPAVGRSQRQRG